MNTAAKFFLTMASRADALALDPQQGELARKIAETFRQRAAEAAIVASKRAKRTGKRRKRA
jgi:hypothetical protein